MLAAIRIRGEVGLNPKIRRALELLRLFRINHLVLIEEKDTGLLESAQSFITWGEIDAETLAMLLEKRARFPGNKHLDDEFMKKHKIKSFDELAQQIIDGKKGLEEIGLKPIFRLGPPKKGHKRLGIKQPYAIGGALGYRAKDINGLIRKMC